MTLKHVGGTEVVQIVTFSEELKRLRTQAGLTMDSLGRRVGCVRSYIADMESGRRPPTLQMVRDLDDALSADGQLVMAFDQERADDVDAWWPDSPDALRTAAAALWADPAGDASTEDASVAILPGDVRGIALRWLIAPVETGVANEAGGPRIGRSEVQRLRGVRQRVKDVDNTYGGRTALPIAMAFLRHEAGPILKGRYDEATGCELLAVVAQIELDVAWMAYDAGRHGLARRCFVWALRLSKAGRDVLLGSRALAGLSHQALHVGRISEAVDLADAARAVSEPKATPQVVAMLASMNACAQAARGHRALCEAALRAAEDAIGGAEPRDSQWPDFDEGGLWGHAARCYRDLRQPAKAAEFAARSVDLCLEGHDRTRAQRIAIQAAAQVQLGDAELAADLGLRMLDSAQEVRSGHVDQEVARLTQSLETKGVGGDFHEQARVFLTASCIGGG